MSDEFNFLGKTPEEMDTNPLAQFCSLCGQGYHSDLPIDIGENPTKGEYRWAHVVCLDDHAALFMEMFGDEV